MSNKIAISKIGENVLNISDPNDFILSSDYNTFKIILSGTKSVTLTGSTADQTITQAHGQDFIPLVSAFAKVDDESQVFIPNGYGVILITYKTLITNGIYFNYVDVDEDNIYFNFDNNNMSDKDITIRFLILEGID
jgi:hypothetical protein